MTFELEVGMNSPEGGPRITERAHPADTTHTYEVEKGKSGQASATSLNRSDQCRRNWALLLATTIKTLAAPRDRAIGKMVGWGLLDAPVCEAWVPASEGKYSTSTAVALFG